MRVVHKILFDHRVLLPKKVNPKVVSASFYDPYPNRPDHPPFSYLGQVHANSQHKSRGIILGRTFEQENKMTHA